MSPRLRRLKALGIGSGLPGPADQLERADSAMLKPSSLLRSTGSRYGASVLMVSAVLLLRHYAGAQPAGLAYVLAAALGPPGT